MAELMKDAELEEVVGGSGAECIGLMARLQSAGLASFKTPLVAGNEEAAAAELKTYLNSFKYPANYPAGLAGSPIFGYCEIYADGRANDYKTVSAAGANGEVVAFRSLSADDVFGIIKNLKGM